MLYTSTLEEVQEYWKSQALSQSFLKAVMSNNTKFKEKFSTIIGSCIDAQLTCPHLINDLFSVGMVNRPSDTIQGIIDKAWEITCLEPVVSAELELYKDLFLQIANEEKLGNGKWKEETVWNKILEGKSYWEELFNAGGRKIVSQEEWDFAEKYAMMITSSSITGKYFMDQENVDKYYQKGLYWTMYGEQCKGLGDIFVVEHETKTIYYVDIKGTEHSSLEMWFHTAKSLKYPFQLAWYKEGIERDPVFKPLIDSGYKLKFRWMVIPFVNGAHKELPYFTPWIINADGLLLSGELGYYTNKSIKIGEKMTDISTYVYGWKYAFLTYQECKRLGLNDFNLNHYKTQGKISEKDATQLFFS